MLAEFDEGKRSCRKRLAGHNERRRKPQFDTHLGKAAKLLHLFMGEQWLIIFFAGSTYFTTDASKTSLIFSRILPGGFFSLQCNEPTNRSGHLKLKEEPSQTSQLSSDMKFGHSLPKSILRFNGIGKQYPSKSCLKTPLSFPEFSGGSNSSCVLSLLSAQSQDLLSNSAGNHHANLFTVQNSATLSKNFSPIISNSSGVELEGFSVVPNARVTVGSEIPQSAVSQEPNVLKLKRYPSPEGANTVDLLELSLHLQRIEQQKYYSQVKLENGIFCDSTIT